MQERFRHLDAQCEPGLERSILTTPSCDMFIAQLKEYPHDPETWKLLLDAAETSGDIARICEAYDALLSQYPNTAAAQIEYTKHFLGSPESHGEAEKLLSKFLKVSPSSDLWKLYIDYARRTASGPNKHEVLRKAFVFALDHIGQDRDSGSIWADYILLLQAVVANTPFQAQQKINTLRTVYQHAVRIPLDNVEYLWMQYESFEMELDRITAKKIMKDIFPAHMQARTVLRQLNVHLTRLGKSDRCGIFLPSPATFSAQEHMLIKSWKSYLRWEEANPLEIDTQDRDVLLGRITNAYRLAVIRMRYYPEIWKVIIFSFMSYSWTASVGKTEEAISILKAGLEPNPDSFALTYAYAEVLEKTEVKKDRPDFAKIHSVYERFFGVLRANLARLEAVSYPPESPAQYVNGQGTADVVPANAALTQDIAVLRKEFAEHRKQYSNAWINYMRFARRAQGQKGCRSAFGKARSEDYVGWEVYDAAAMSEYHCNLEHGRAVAARIFETGMKKFGSDVPYVLAHLTYLLTINDENNSRALFERVIGTLTPQDAVPVWELWSQSQYNHEDLEATLELQRRMAKVYPKGAVLVCRPSLSIVPLLETIFNVASPSSWYMLLCKAILYTG
ncbi:hypothetical protein C8R47DRAFT_966772 [Mycena vitilis]|nr:hypothetical protein C8R47DRAFT_966772 [Mycena vitilis]